MIDAEPQGLRARKRQETVQRITDAAVCLFIEKGYDETTLTEIAAEAGISRRTFFSYFRSKDDVLLSIQNGMGDMLADAVRTASPDKAPVEAVRDAVVQVCTLMPAEDMKALDAIMRSSEAVQARKQATYVQQEKILLAALQERWPDPARATGLRLIAMLAVGAVRLSLEAFAAEDNQKQLPELVTGAFAALQHEL